LQIGGDNCIGRCVSGHGRSKGGSGLLQVEHIAALQNQADIRMGD
jgi:hypothetical protein